MFLIGILERFIVNYVRTIPTAYLIIVDHILILLVSEMSPYSFIGLVFATIHSEYRIEQRQVALLKFIEEPMTLNGYYPYFHIILYIKGLVLYFYSCHS